MINLYGRGGLIILVILMDVWFDNVAEILVKIEVNIASAREHVGEVYITIITVKEHGRGIINTLPYFYITSNIIIHLVCFILMWLDSLPGGKGISQNCSLREIVTGQHIYFKKYCRVAFRLYEEDHYEPNITNNIYPRTHKYIVLGPTENIQGKQNAFCMNSVRVPKRR